MAKIDATVRRETVYIAAWVAVLSLLMQAVFLLIGYWELPVLWGNLLGAVTAVGNFLLMGLTVQMAVGKEKKDAARTVQLSQSGRLILQGLVLVLAATVDAFDLWAAAIPLLMPRIAIALRPLFNKKMDVPSGDEPDSGGDTA